jgi:transposase InsO family protein
MIPRAERKNILEWIEIAHQSGARYARAGEVIGLSERTIQRWKQFKETKDDGRQYRVFEPSNKLSEHERQQVIAIANSAEYAHLSPSQIVPALAEKGIYIASESTFSRLLAEQKQNAHRQASRPAHERHKPKALTATAPNQLYSWDITYLMTTIKGRYLYLYLFMDIFSRKIIGWQVYEQESSQHAADVMTDIVQREGITKEQVTLHSDNGSPMKGATMLATLQALGIVPSFSRPAVSNDNAYSESLFRTLKYRPNYPCKPFAELADARQWVDGFVSWYNHEHRHSAIQYVTPDDRHKGKDVMILQRRKALYEAAKARHPERWTSDTRNCEPVEAVYLNPEKMMTKSAVNEIGNTA